jgi:hypothetical protein
MMDDQGDPDIHDCFVFALSIEKTRIGMQSAREAGFFAKSGLAASMQGQ